MADALRALAATGHINQTDADQLAHFADHGWLLMERAIEPELVDTLVGDIHNLHQHPGYFATTDFRDGRPQKLNGNRPDALESIFDLYVNLQSSRHVCMHPRIVRFLSLVFQAKVLAFQQLLFQVTNGHQWHQDTAYVVVDTPTLLVATWIALQDIQEGSGELAYYDQSHRLPHYIFSNGTQHSDGDTPNYSREVEEACRRVSWRIFVCWRSRATCSSGQQTWCIGAIRCRCRRARRACLRDDIVPPPRAALVLEPDKRGIEPYWAVGGFASSFYKLPNLSTMVRPVPRWEFYN